MFIILVRFVIPVTVILVVYCISLPQVLTPVGECDIPTELVDRLQEEKKIEVVRRKEKSEAHLYMNLKVMFEDCFHGHHGNDLYDTERVNANFSQEVCVK